MTRKTCCSLENAYKIVQDEITRGETPVYGKKVDNMTVRMCFHLFFFKTCPCSLKSVVSHTYNATSAIFRLSCYYVTVSISFDCFGTF